VEKAEPEDVADLIVDALRFGRFEVYVPKAVGRISKAMNILPRRASEAIGHYLEADQVMAQADMSGRRAYEERVAKSEPTPLEVASQAREAQNVPSDTKEPVG